MSEEGEKIKRPRKANWSASEMEILVAEVGTRSSLLFSSFSSTVNMKMKRKGWEEVAETINSNSSTKRDWAEVKKKWTDMKSQTRKRAATNKRERGLTGGGPPPNEQLNSIEQMVVSLIPSCQLEGCEGGLESEECNPLAEDAILIAEVPNSVDEPVPQLSSSHYIPSVESTEQSTCTQSASSSSVHLQPVSSATDIMGKTKGQILVVEEKKCDILQELLNSHRELVDVQKQLLAVEMRRLKLEEEKLEFLKNSDKSVSPIIKFY